MKERNLSMCVCLRLLILHGQVGELDGIPTETPAAVLGGNEEVKPWVSISLFPPPT